MAEVHFLERHWQERTLLSLVLLPLSWLYCGLAGLRRQAYRRRWLRAARLPVPVVVVGNITVGGTGKTPLVVWLARMLTAAGLKPGIVTRGYQGKGGVWPATVTAQTDPAQVGDEAVLLARNAGCPVVAGPDRVAAARALLAQFACDVVLSDDGLQHYRLARDVEIAVIDGARRFGNGRCLPAGPLREGLRRLRGVDVRVTQGSPAPGELGMVLAPVAFRSLAAPGRTRPPDAFVDQRAHALAGIGNPARFFAALRGLGLRIIAHPFPDHHAFRPEDIRFEPEVPVIMTEKDAVKCERFAGPEHWYLAVEARPDPGLGPRILQILKRALNERRDG